jgi:hypothetical protein
MHQVCGDCLTTVHSERRFNTEQGAQCGISDANDAGSNDMNEPQVTQSHHLFSELRRRGHHPGRRWNSTVTGIDGQIREGARLRVHAPRTDRTFTPTVSGVVAPERMTWTGGLAPIFKGVRTFALAPRSDGSTDFTMKECFSGLILPLCEAIATGFRAGFRALRQRPEAGSGAFPR